MHIGKAYRWREFLHWTRRKALLLLAYGLVPVTLYQVVGLRWLTVPVAVVAILGTAAAFIVGFKNAQTLSRLLEAQQIWTSIHSSGRYFGSITRDFVPDAVAARTLALRHIAWVTALRYELRSPRVWETVDEGANAEYQVHYRIPERETSLSEELHRLLSDDESASVIESSSRPHCVLDLQSRAITKLTAQGTISVSYALELRKVVKEANEQQGRAERLKNFPYPRQYAVINTLFVWAFCLLLPLGLLREFDRLNDGLSGLMQGVMVWLVVPFSAMISWMYTVLEQVGNSTENPFEGSANDVPISHIAATLEHEMLITHGEKSTCAVPKPLNDIIL